MKGRTILACILTMVILAGIWFAEYSRAQTNPVYEPIVPLFRKLRAMLDAEIFLLEQRRAVLDAQITYVTAEVPGSELLLESGGSIIREVWLDAAGLTIARIDELILALQ